MTTPNAPNPQAITPEQLTNQLFDASLMQHMSDPREAARQVIIFLSEALVYAISSTVPAGDDNARKELLKSVGDAIATAPPIPNKSKP